jgi:hypothetical protein
MDSVAILLTPIETAVRSCHTAETGFEGQRSKSALEDHLEPGFGQAIIHCEENDLGSVAIIARVTGTGSYSIDLQ